MHIDRNYLLRTFYYEHRYLEQYKDLQPRILLEDVRKSIEDSINVGGKVFDGGAYTQTKGTPKFLYIKKACQINTVTM